MNVKRRQQASRRSYQFVRLRTALYAAVIAVVGGIMVYTLATRDSEGISVIHDRNPMFVRLSDGALRNAYTIRIVNKQLKHARLHRSASTGLPSSLSISSAPAASDGRQLLSTSGPTRRARCASW